ncbi:hypothetical protein K440DRAFT_410019 [Wilcoxina mikolae CBS 423.85]|nr:hypothetical protein K440DRAFT_410019 [Wilcoxina mikolae CBS 423.85]
MLMATYVYTPGKISRIELRHEPTYVGGFSNHKPDFLPGNSIRVVKRASSWSITHQPANHSERTPGYVAGSPPLVPTRAPDLAVRRSVGKSCGRCRFPICYNPRGTCICCALRSNIVIPWMHFAYRNPHDRKPFVLHFTFPAKPHHDDGCSANTGRYRTGCKFP